MCIDKTEDGKVIWRCFVCSLITFVRCGQELDRFYHINIPHEYVMKFWPSLDLNKVRLAPFPLKSCSLFVVHVSLHRCSKGSDALCDVRQPDRHQPVD
jgi:hypothetical protein